MNLAEMRKMPNVIERGEFALKHRIKLFRVCPRLLFLHMCAHEILPLHLDLHIIHTHGDKANFRLGETTENDGYRYTVSDIKNTDMSNANLVIYLTCKGGKDYSETNCF